MVERNEDTEWELVQAIDEDMDGHDFESMAEDEGLDEDDTDDMDGVDEEELIESYVANLSDEEFQERYESRVVRS